MKIALVSLRPQVTGKMKREIQKSSLTIVKKNPDVVLCVGGDGSLLYAEQLFPGVPKMLYRQSEVANKAIDGAFTNIIRRLEKGKYKIKKMDKLALGKRLALNDVIIRNRHQQEALRFKVKINNKTTEMLIGDGVVIATPFGSAGYFYSITRRKFAKGIGIAFNNIHNTKIQSQIGNGPIKITVLRGEAIVSADNNRKTITLKEKQSITVQKARERAKIIVL